MSPFELVEINDVDVYVATHADCWRHNVMCLVTTRFRGMGPPIDGSRKSLTPPPSTKFAMVPWCATQALPPLPERPLYRQPRAKPEASPARIHASPPFCSAGNVAFETEEQRRRRGDVLLDIAALNFQHKQLERQKLSKSTPTVGFGVSEPTAPAEKPFQPTTSTRAAALRKELRRARLEELRSGVVTAPTPLQCTRSSPSPSPADRHPTVSPAGSGNIIPMLHVRHHDEVHGKEVDSVLPIVDFSFLDLTSPSMMLTVEARPSSKKSLFFFDDQAAATSQPVSPKGTAGGGAPGAGDAGAQKSTPFFNQPAPAPPAAAPNMKADILAAQQRLIATLDAARRKVPVSSQQSVIVINSKDTTYAFDETKSLSLGDDAMDTWLNGPETVQRRTSRMSSGAIWGDASDGVALYTSSDVLKRRECCKYDGTYVRLCHSNFPNLDVIELADALDAVIAPMPTTVPTPFDAKVLKRTQRLLTLDLSDCSIRTIKIPNGFSDICAVSEGRLERSALTPWVAKAVGEKRQRLGTADHSVATLTQMTEASIFRAVRCISMISTVHTLYLHGNALESLSEVGKLAPLLRGTLLNLTLHGNEAIDVRGIEAKATLLRWFPHLECLNLARLSPQDMQHPLVAKARQRGLEELREATSMM